HDLLGTSHAGRRPVVTAVLDARDVTVRIGDAVIVAAADLSLERGEGVALVGPDGAGKTTLVRALAGLLPFRGDVLLEGRPLDALGARARARRIAYLPQGHVFHWPLPVAAVVALGRHPHADGLAAASPQDHAAVRQALAATGIETLAGRSIATLSGGE